MSRTKYHSWKLNSLALGCRECVLGRKLVVFVTGICPRNCFYCPLSEQKKDKDVIYANERQLADENDIASMIEEARMSQSWGAGFTGGDPLVRIDRTCKFIRALKEEFGKKFHIHLYTITESLTEERLKKLEDAGLDELRLHPDISCNKNWNKLGLIFSTDGKKKYSFDIGVEIPSIPGHEAETRRLVDYFIPKIDFLNLNELEISDTNSCELVEREFHAKDRTSYGVKGSGEMALRLMRYIYKKYPKARVHYCTCKLKDGVQLKERLRLRAKRSHKKFDIVTHDGTIVRGVIYDKRLVPGHGYMQKIRSLTDDDRQAMLKTLQKQLDDMVHHYVIPKALLDIDALKPRIITNVGIVQRLEKHLKKQGLIPAIVEQYPSYDQMEVDVEFL